MPVIKIDLWEGRTDEQKEKLISAVTKAVCESIGCPQEAVWIMIQDYKKSNWGMNGRPANKE